MPPTRILLPLLACLALGPAACGGGGGGDSEPAANGPAEDDDGAGTASTITFTSPEWDLVNTFSPLPPVPPDPTNRYADDPDAATLGQQYFFDPRFSGEVTHAANDGTGPPANGNQGEVGTLSCARCHQPGNGFTDGDHVDGSSLGAGGFTGRNAPTLLNAAYYPFFFWAGRKDSQWSQALAPTESPIEMNFNRVQLAMVIRDHYMPSSPNPPDPDHFDVFQDDFLPDPLMATILDDNQTHLEDIGFPPAGSPPAFPTQGRPGDSADGAYDPNLHASYDDDLNDAEKTAIDRIFSHWAKAIAAYERLLTSTDSAFDQWVAQGNADGPDDRGGYGANDTISAAAKRGFKVFVGQGQCNVCHKGPNFSDHFDDGTTITAPFHNIGVEQSGTHIPGRDDDEGLDDAIDPVLSDPFRGSLGAATIPAGFSDDAAFGANKLALIAALPSPGSTANKGEFKTTGLRSIARTAPYMHTGQLGTLEEVVTFYNSGGGNAALHNGTNELNMLALTPGQQADLVAFMEALDGAPLPTVLVTAPPLP